MKRILSIISDCAIKHHTDPVSIYYSWIDWMVEMVCAQRMSTDIISLLKKMQEDNIDYYNLFILWIELTQRDIKEKGVHSDYIGMIYEEFFQSTLKANHLGQFFTPHSVSSLCSKLAESTQYKGVIRINDSTCGSGRMPIKVWENINHDEHPYVLFQLSDIDSISVKMAALNMYVNGMIGVVSKMDTLTQEWEYCYIINRIKTPYLNDYVSIEHIANEDQYRNILDTMSKLMDYGYRRFKGIHIADTTCSAHIPVKKNTPVQLELFSDGI